MTPDFFGGVTFFLAYVKSKRKKNRKLTETETNSTRYRSRLVTCYNKRWSLIIPGRSREVIFAVGTSLSGPCRCREVEIRVNAWPVWRDNKNGPLGRSDCNSFFCFFNLMFSRLYGRQREADVDLMVLSINKSMLCKNDSKLEIK